MGRKGGKERRQGREGKERRGEGPREGVGLFGPTLRFNGIDGLLKEVQEQLQAKTAEAQQLRDDLEKQKQDLGILLRACQETMVFAADRRPQTRFLGRGCDKALFSGKKGFSEKRSEAIQ